MLTILKSKNGMSIFGQGPAIIRVGLVFMLIGFAVYKFFPAITVLPVPLFYSTIAGIILLLCGLLLWVTSLVQLLRDFPKGKLITTGAYRFCRNPMYASFIIFIIPAFSFLLHTWVYFLGSLGMWLGATILLCKEERILEDIFKNEFSRYAAAVGRIFPKL
jgi:protein-S-isoprenylcysteine O-methyltransferase Ste14